MSYVIPPFVDEHEPGPDYNCVFASGLMQYLALHVGAAPATHAEVAALRAASGLGTTGPASSLNLIVGDRNRYHWQPVEIPRGFASLWASLTPGHGATASGHPTDAPAGSPFRHWLPNYAGGHRVFVERMDTSDRVWLMDPEGPAVGWHGEWASKADLAAFVANGSSHTVAPLAIAESGGPNVPGGDVSYPVPKVPSVGYIPAGKTVWDNAALFGGKSIVVTPGRNMPYLGAPTNDARIVEYVDANGVHTGVAMYVAKADLVNIAPATPSAATKLGPGLYEV